MIIKSNYSIENYTNPYSTYKDLSNKIKLGHLVFNIQKKSFEIVDLKILEIILMFEKEADIERIYYPIPINSKWLTKVFNFEAKPLHIYYMNVYTSKIHRLKIHEQHNRYFIAYTIREKVKITDTFKGTISSKPEILYVHELMDQLYLLKREEILINTSELSEINTIFKDELNES